MINGISIKNFKGIGDPGIELNLEPVTLLFGSNSAGKSSIFHAMLLAYEVLVRGNRNPDKTEIGGAVIDLGGFRRFVHQHQTHKPVTLRFDLDMASVSFDREWPIAEELIEIGTDAIDVSKVGEEIWTAAVEIDLSWDNDESAPFISKYSVELDGTPFAQIRDIREKLLFPLEQKYLTFDRTHPLLASPQNDEDVIGILDHFVPGLPTEGEQLFRDADSLGLHDLEEIMWHAIDSVDLNEDDWDEMPFESQERHAAAVELDNDDHLRESIIAADGQSDEDGSSYEGPDPLAVQCRGFDVLKALDGVTFRTSPQFDEDDRPFQVLLYRLSNGIVGVVGGRFNESDGWERMEIHEALDTWAAIIGLPIGLQESRRCRIDLNSPDALPEWNRPLDLMFGDRFESDSEEDVSPNTSFAVQLLSRLMIVPGQALCRALSGSRYIGPLREIPSRQFAVPNTPDPSRWANGLAAWDYLTKCSDETLEEISHWLADEQRLGTRHKILRQRFRELASDSLEITRLESDDYLDELERIRDLILSREEFTRIKLRDTTLEVDIDPHDCAIGIAQLVPVVVAGVMARKEPDNRGMFLIEQPELHNHPSVEVGLGDLFVETIHQNHCRFILETHGEHLILRMLRRIRETTENELPEGVKGLLPDEVAVYCIERTANGVTAKHLRIDETGEFIDRWPNGFFRERGKELF